MTEPASIRYKNPGAMWGGERAKKWGATNTIGLNDGLGQGNNIAVFPTFVQGASAQFDLWRSNYTGITLAAAIKRWSGGNSSQAYMTRLTNETGIKPNDLITPALLAGPKGIALMKAQADWEAGTKYPMSDAAWAEAQRRAFATKSSGGKVAGAVVTGGAIVAGSYFGGLEMFIVFLVGAVAGAVGMWFGKERIQALLPKKVP